MITDLTHEQVRIFFDYNFRTGKLYWRRRGGDSRGTKTFNSRFAGMEAGTVSGSGYIGVRIKSRSHQAHRIAWLWMTGRWPSEGVDHINGDKTDNSFSNLRAVSQGENCRNQRLRNTNTSGSMGVHWDKQRSKWRAYISSGGKMIHLGLFEDKAEAIEARKTAENKYGYHKNHGRR